LLFCDIVRVSAEVSCLVILLAVAERFPPLSSHLRNRCLGWALIPIGLLVLPFIRLAGLFGATWKCPLPAGLLSAIALLWLAGALILFARGIVKAAYLHYQVSRRDDVTDEAIRKVFEECRKAVGVRIPVRLVVTSLTSGPSLVGVSHPVLLLPRYRMDRLSLEDLRFIFLHELAHVHRLDQAVSWLLGVLRVLHWFNPLIGYAFRRLREAVEIACDEKVLQCAGEGAGVAYGQTLLRLSQTGEEQAVSASTRSVRRFKEAIAGRIVHVAEFGASRRNPVSSSDGRIRESVRH
jgi:bla regulator protein BlaR1